MFITIKAFWGQAPQQDETEGHSNSCSEVMDLRKMRNYYKKLENKDGHIVYSLFQKGSFSMKSDGTKKRQRIATVVVVLVVIAMVITTVVPAMMMQRFKNTDVF